MPYFSVSFRLMPGFRFAFAAMPRQARGRRQRSLPRAPTLPPCRRRFCRRVRDRRRVAAARCVVSECCALTRRAGAISSPQAARAAARHIVTIIMPTRHYCHADRADIAFSMTGRRRLHALRKVRAIIDRASPPCCHADFHILSFSFAFSYTTDALLSVIFA